MKEKNRNLKRFFSTSVWMGGLLLLSFILVSCGGNTTDGAATPTFESLAFLPACIGCPPTETPTPVPTSTPVPTATPAPTATPSGPSYAADIQPIFTERCIKCHSGENPPRGLRLIDYENVLQGGTYRAVITPGDAAESELARRIRGEAIPRMPFDGPPFLEDEQIALIEAWIAAGALDN